MQTIRTNLVNNASTQYTNHNFQSMIECHGVLLGAGTIGLRKICCSADDETVDIDAYFILPKSDFGLKDFKRNRYAYFNYECSGDMTISMVGDDKTTIGPYTVTAVVTQGSQQRRIKLGRGLKWNYGLYRVDNVDGSSFSIDSIILTLQGDK